MSTDIKNIFQKPLYKVVVIDYNNIIVDND